MAASTARGPARRVRGTSAGQQDGFASTETHIIVHPAPADVERRVVLTAVTGCNRLTSPRQTNNAPSAST
jgi:hypothetical protein